MYFITIKISGKIEENPAGLQSKSCNRLSICHWNLNSIPAYDFIKLSPFHHAYISVNQFDIWLSRTYLDSSTSSNDDNLEVPGYTLVHTDNQSDTKRDRVCVYLNSLPLKVLYTNLLKECINFEITRFDLTFKK